MPKKLYCVLLMILLILMMTMSGTGEHDNTLKNIVTTAGNIPVMETYIDDGKQKPVILVQHGFKNQKESTTGISANLAKQGFFVISPDAYGHGQRTEKPLSLVEIIVKTAEDYDSILASYKRDDRADISNLGITGFSMGGCITFYYTVNGMYEPKAIAPTIATPYFEQLIGSRLGRSCYSSETGVRVATEREEIDRIEKYIKDHSPYKGCEELKELPILMQNGQLDTYVGSEGVKLLYDSLKKTNPHITLIMIPETKHKVTEDMKVNIIDFMTEELLPNS